jgi:hypothetical protein
MFVHTLSLLVAGPRIEINAAREGCDGLGEILGGKCPVARLFQLHRLSFLQLWRHTAHNSGVRPQGEDQ